MPLPLPHDGHDGADGSKGFSKLSASLELTVVPQANGGGDKGGEHTVLPSSGKDEPLLMVSYFSLFRFADRVDALLMLVGSLGAIGNGAAMPIFALIFGNLLNSFGNSAATANSSELKDQTTHYSLTFIWLGLGACVAAYLQVASWTYTGVRQVNRLRHRYLDAVLRQETAFFETTATSGRLLQGINEDCNTIQQAIGDKAGMTLFNLSTAVSGMIIAFYRGWDVTLVLLAVMPLLAVAGVSISYFMVKYNATINRAYADANTVAQQALGNIRTVYAFNGEERTAEAYESVLERPAKAGIKMGFLSSVGVGLTNCFAFCGYALALWYGSTRIIAGKYEGGDVISVIFSAIIGGFALGQAAPSMQYFAQGRSAGGRVFEIMRRVPHIDLDAPGRELESVKGRVELRGVAFAYPARPDIQVFHDFDLVVEAGQTVALVGESGSGKSTVIGLIERFYDPQGGQVLLDGVDIRTLQLRWLRTKIGLVSQESTLFATTIRGNIAYGRPDATQEEIEAAARASNAHRFIMNLPRGYDTHVGEKGVQMSGGQKQRIAIARAILKNPAVLLLDEATSALDARSEHVVQAALDGLMQGRTTVVVAHRLSTVIGADMIAVVKKGCIVEEGTHAELMERQGAYHLLVQMQQAEGRGEEEEDEGASEGEGDVERGEAGADDLPASDELASSPRASLEGVVEVVRDGLPGVVSTTKGPAASVMPALAYDRSVSGVRRFVSLRRRKQNKPKKEVGHKKSTAEEKAKKVPLSRLAALNKAELPFAAGGLAGSAALGLLMPVFAVAFSSIVADFFNPSNEELKSGVRKWSLVFLGIGLGAVVAALLQGYCFNYMGQRLALRVRVLMIRALLRQEVGWYDEERNSSGVLAAKLASDTLAVKGQFGDTMGMITQNMFTLAGGLVVAFIRSWKLTLVVLAGLPLIGAASWVHTKFLVTAADKEDESFAQANQTASEAFTNIRTVAAFSMERQVSSMFEHKLKEPTKEAVSRANTGGLAIGFSNLALFGMYALAFWYAGVLVSGVDSTDPYVILDSFQDQLQAFFGIFLAAMGMAQAQLYFPDVAKGKSATQRVFTIIDREPLIDATGEEGARPLACTGTVELRDITFAYPQRPEVCVFRRFNLLAPAGHTVALVGESGSGKSTVVGLIERFYDPQGGQVLLDGADIRTLNLRWLRDNVGLVGQEPVLFNLTVEGNIKYGRPDASREDVVAAARAANAEAFIERLPEGYATRLGEGGIQLSGGQKQRIAIARALVKDPRVLLLDEATSALDAESEAVVQEALDRLMQGRTTVVVAHRLSTIRDADSIAVVSQGHIIEQGSHEELMARPQGHYSRLIKLQLQRSASTVRIAAR